MECVLSKNDSVISELVAQFGKEMINFIYRMVKSREDAEDIAQDALTRAYESIGKGSTPNDMRKWLFTICYNLAMNHITQNELHTRIIRSLGDAGKIPVGDKSAEMETLLEKITGTHRAIFILRFIHGFKYSEIADVVNLPESTCMVYVNRALKTLRENSKELDK